LNREHVLAFAMASYVDLLRECTTAVLGGHIPAATTLKMLLSKTLGYGIVVGAAVVKVPQVANVLAAGNAEGLAASSFEIEQVALLVGLLYSLSRQLPFSAYGEAVLLLIQNFVLLGLINYHRKTSKVLALLKLAAFLGVLLAGLQGALPAEALDTAYGMSALLVVAARVPQILKNLREKSTGQLSIITMFMQFAGSAARVFTSIAEKGGTAMVYNYALSLALNTVILAQIVYYRPKKPPQKTE